MFRSNTAVVPPCGVKRAAVSKPTSVVPSSRRRRWLQLGPSPDTLMLVFSTKFRPPSCSANSNATPTTCLVCSSIARALQCGIASVITDVNANTHQVLASASWSKRPSGQTMHREEFTSAIVPAKHGSHPSLGLGVYCPAGQPRHVVALVATACLPTLHVVQIVDALKSSSAFPSGQCTQCRAVSRPTTVPCEPAAQRVHSVDPAALWNCPNGHSVQEETESTPYSPAGHGVHADAPGLSSVFVTEPTRHSAHMV